VNGQNRREKSLGDLEWVKKSVWMISDSTFFQRLDTATGFRVSLYEETFRAQGMDQTVSDFWMKRCEELVSV